LCYNAVVAVVVFSDAAVRHFKRLPKVDRAFVREGMRIHLATADPAASSRNKFRLRRVSPCGI